MRRNDKMESLLNKIKQERKKNFDKIKRLEIELFKISYANNSNELQSELKGLNKNQVVAEKLHEIRNETLTNYTGEFDVVGKCLIGDQLRETHIRFRNITNYEAYINYIDESYDAEDAIFNGYSHKLVTPHLI